jgi:hypothetical protein
MIAKTKYLHVILVFILFILPFCHLLAQEKSRFTCYFSPNLSGDFLCEEVRALSYSDEIDARAILQRVLEPVGLRPNFVLQPCDSIENCVATIGENGWRFILYDRVFLKKLVSKDGNDWSSISIFAHEVLHHLNQHTHLVKDASLQKRRQMELEADEWSGRILAMLGATLEEAQSAIRSLNYAYDETFSSHPSKEQRLEAIERGFQSGASQANSRRPKMKINMDDVSMQHHQFIKLNSFDEAKEMPQDGWVLKNLININDNPYIFNAKYPDLLPNHLVTKNQIQGIQEYLNTEGAWLNKLDKFKDTWYGLKESTNRRYGQLVRTMSKLDLNDIQMKKAMGTVITDIAFGDGMWVILQENKDSAKVDDQIVQVSEAFPASEISQLWKNFYVVISCKFLNNQWVTVFHKFTKDAFVTTQVQGYKTTFPVDEFLRFEKEGFRLEMANFDGYYWGYIMNKVKGFTYENVKQ